jgi:hypothetical protein
LEYLSIGCAVRPLKNVQMQGAREWTSVGVLMQYVGASPSERNAAGGRLWAA